MNHLTLDVTNLNQLSDHRDRSLLHRLRNAEKELANTKKELVNVDLKLLSRGALLKDLYRNIESIRNLKNIDEIKSSLYKLKSSLDFKLDEERCWDSFQNHFDLVQSDFYQKMKSRYSNLSVTDLELCALVKLEMCNKEIANQLNISVRGVETRRYRLKKKLDLSRNERLIDFLVSI